MRTVAIAIQDGEGLDAAVDPRFGRAARFVIAAADGSAVEVLDNPGVQAAHGAGIGAAALLVRRGVGAVVAGRPFFADGSGRGTIRLSFSQAPDDVIDAAVAELGRILAARMSEWAP